MRNSLALLIFLLLALSGFFMSNGEETTLKDSVSIKGRITGELKGIVVDEKGDPVKGAIVVTDKTFTVNEGFVIKKEETADFLEKSLITLGLNFKEANEFIIYWLPELEKHPYNLIHFSTKEYEELAELTVDPKPDTIIRVFMVFKGLDSPVEIKEQKLVPKSRKGFIVVEWGGSEIISKNTGIR